MKIWPVFLLLLLTNAFAVDKVKVGSYINDIQNLDLHSHSYTVDLYIWFKWQNPAIDPSSSFEFMNAFETWGHTVTKANEKPVKLSDGTLYQSVRVQGRFSHKFLLINYPFDKEKLIVKIEDTEAEKNRILFVADDFNPITLNPEIKFPGFTLGQPILKIENHQYPTNFGVAEIGEKANYHQVKIEIPITRPIIPYLVKLMLPIICVVFSTSLMFLFNPKFIDSRVGIGITSLLTIVALQLTLNEDLPEIDYLVLMDKIYIVTYLFVVLGLGVVVVGSWILEKGEENLARVIKLDRIALGGLLAVYSFTSMALILFAIINRG